MLASSDEEKEALLMELRALRAAAASAGGEAASAADQLVADAMSGAREAMLEVEAEGLRSRLGELEEELRRVLTEHAELLKNPAWETEVPEEEWRAELQEQQAVMESLLEEHAAMEGEIATFHGQKAAMEAKIESLAAEKKSLQNQLNAMMITSSDADNRLQELERELEVLREEKAKAEAELEETRSASVINMMPPASTAVHPRDAETAQSAALEQEVAQLKEEIQELMKQSMAQLKIRGM